jgi:hypothetical protein
MRGAVQAGRTTGSSIGALGGPLLKSDRSRANPTVATDSYKAVESPSDGLQPAFSS